MERQELEKKLLKRLKKIRDMYYKAYPNGDYLTIAFYKDFIQFNNCHWDYDSEFPIDYWEDEDTEDDSERI